MDNKDFIEKVQGKAKAHQDSIEKAQMHQDMKGAIDDAVEKVVASNESTKDVVVKNFPKSLAKSEDIQKLGNELKIMNDKTGMLDPVLLQQALTLLQKQLSELPAKFPEVKIPAFPELPEPKEEVKITNFSDISKYFSSVVNAINKIDVKPEVSVKSPDVKVASPSVDLNPLIKEIKALSSAFDKLTNKPDKEIDINPIIEGLSNVSSTISSLTFPVPNYILPFKDTNGRATQVQLDGSGNLPISASISGADGALLDGANATIKATVKDLTNSNPLTTALVDANGDQITSFGGGTQYTEGDTDASITGTAIMFESNTGTNAISTVNSTTPLPVTLANTGANATAVKVDGSAVTQPVNISTVSTSLFVEQPTAASLNMTEANSGTIVTNTGNTATNTTNIPNVVGTAAAAIPSKLLQVGGSDGTNARAIKTNTSGQLDIRPLTTSDAITTTASVVGGGTEATAQRVTIASDSTGVLSVDDNGSSLTVDGTVAASNFPATVDTNSGNKSASTLRVVLATDQPALTNKLLVTPDANSAVNVAQIGGNNVSAGVGTSGTGTLRVVQANDAGKTLLSKSGSASSSGNNTLVAAGTNRLKVFAFSLTTTSTTAVTCKFQDGASGTDLWSVVLQAPSGANTGANLVVNPPAWLFATTAATLLNLNLSSANAVQWSVSYFDEA